MRCVTVSVFVCLLSLAVPAIAGAQCSEIVITPASQQLSDTCSSPVDIHEPIYDSKTFDLATKTACQLQRWKIQYNDTGTLFASARGECGNAGGGQRPNCHGDFVAGPTDLGFSNGKHKAGMTTQDIVATQAGCDYDGLPYEWEDEVTSEDCQAEFCCGSTVASECSGLQGDFNYSTCECNFATPILLDMKGDGFQLTSFEDGVRFDIASCGTLRRMAWTAAGSDDAFLVYDRNGNGVVDGGKELFGSQTTQPKGEQPNNGFEALRVLDQNGDGMVSPADPAFAALQLWTDRNHDGRSDPSELRGLWESGVEEISVRYRESRRRDEHGNWFKFQAAVHGLGGPFAYDVYFTLTSERGGGKPRMRTITPARLDFTTPHMSIRPPR